MVAHFLDQIIQAMPERERRDFPPGFTFEKLFRILGLDSIAATGASTRARGDGTFHSRAFAHAPQGRKGLLTLSGGPAAKLMLLDFAPKDTDLALEFPIHLNDFVKDAMPEIIAMIPPGDRVGFEHEMSVPQPPLGMSAMQVLGKLDARVGIFVRLDPSQKFRPAPNAPELPGADAVIVIERLGWVIEALKPQFMPLLSLPDAPVTFTDEAGVLTVRMKGPAGPAPFDYQPVVQFDAKADRIIIASRVALFESVVAGREKVTQSADFTEAWRDLPAEGNSAAYASARLLQTVGDLVAQAVEKEGGSASDKAIFAKIFGWVKPHLGRGQALVVTNQPDGILAVANTSIPVGSSALAGVSTVAVLAGLAVPAFSSARMKAVEMEHMNNLRQVNLALRMCATDNDGKFPEALSELSKYIGTPGLLEFTDRRTHDRTPWLYRKGLTDTSDGKEILVAAPKAGPDGKRAVGFVDGSVRTIPEEEFQKLWNKK
jgi:type II secretory pathway pseudopilin PulG